MSILSAIENTPLVELTNLNSKKPEVKIFGKLEGSNPGGSVKDRAAYWMVKKSRGIRRINKRENDSRIDIGKYRNRPGNVGRPRDIQLNSACRSASASKGGKFSKP